MNKIALQIAIAKVFNTENIDSYLILLEIRIISKISGFIFDMRFIAAKMGLLITHNFK